MNPKDSNILEVIGLESIVQPDCQSLISNLFPILGDKLRNAYHSLLSVPAMEKIGSDARRVTELVNKYSYLDIAGFELPVPEGLKASYLDYANGVLACSSWAANLITRDLDPAIAEMSAIKSVKVARYDTNLIKGSEQDIKTMTALKEDMVRMFDKSFKPVRTYGDLFARNKDFIEFLGVFNTLEKMSIPEPKQVLEKVERMSSLFDGIIEMAKKGELQGVSSQVLNQLSKRAFYLAEQVSFYSIALYHRAEGSSAASDSVKKLIKVLS